MKNFKESFLPEIEKEIDKLKESTNFGVLEEQKRILDKCFGEKFNQICQPTLENIWSETLKQFPNLAGAAYDDASTERNIRSLHESLYFRNLLKYRAIIHFPEIEITNSRGESHVIKDLYVSFFINENGIIEEFAGLRTTYTQDEISVYYVHSHLPSLDTSEFTFQPFCIGSGEIGLVLASCHTKFTPESFMMFCMHIKNFVKWESLEGTPYKYMRDIGKRRGALIEDAYFSSEMATILLELLGSNFKPDDTSSIVTCKVDNNFITAELTDNGEQVLARIVGEKKSYPPDYDLAPTDMVFCTKDSLGNRVPLRSPPMNFSFQKPILNFKGNDIFLKIIDNNDDEKQKQKVYFVEGIVKNFNQKLSRLLTETAIKHPYQDVG